MQVIDLTHLIEENMPVFPGTEKPLLKNQCTLENDGFREKLITMFSHTGTHMDAPSHMLDLKTLEDFSVDHFVGPVTVIEADAYDVTRKHLMQYEEAIMASNFVLLKTGWDKKWGHESYFSDFPALSLDAAHYLAGFNLKGFGVDAISVDHMENENFEVHFILLKQNMVMIENLKALDQAKTGDLLSVLPLNIKEGDGSPVRAVLLRQE